jgi:hypothetical protein
VGESKEVADGWTREQWRKCRKYALFGEWWNGKTEMA